MRGPADYSTPGLAMVSPILPDGSAPPSMPTGGPGFSESPQRHRSSPPLPAPPHSGEPSPERPAERCGANGTGGPRNPRGEWVSAPHAATSAQQSSLALSPPALWVISPDRTGAGTPDSARRQRLIERGRAAFQEWQAHRQRAAAQGSTLSPDDTGRGDSGEGRAHGAESPVSSPADGGNVFLRVMMKQEQHMQEVMQAQLEEHNRSRSELEQELAEAHMSLDAVIEERDKMAADVSVHLDAERRAEEAEAQLGELREAAARGSAAEAELRELREAAARGSAAEAELGQLREAAARAEAAEAELGSFRARAEAAEAELGALREAAARAEAAEAELSELRETAARMQAMQAELGALREAAAHAEAAEAELGALRREAAGLRRGAEQGGAAAEAACGEAAEMRERLADAEARLQQVAAELEGERARADAAEAARADPSAPADPDASCSGAALAQAQEECAAAQDDAARLRQEIAALHRRRDGEAAAGAERAHELMRAQAAAREAQADAARWRAACQDTDLRQELQQQQQQTAAQAALQHRLEQAEESARESAAEAQRWHTLYQELSDANLAEKRRAEEDPLNGYDHDYQHKVNALQLAAQQAEERCERALAEAREADEGRAEVERRLAAAMLELSAVRQERGSAAGGQQAPELAAVSRERDRLLSELTQLRAAYGELQASCGDSAAAPPLGAVPTDWEALNAENQRLCERLREAEEREQSAGRTDPDASFEALSQERDELRMRLEAVSEDLRLCDDPPRQRIEVLEQQVLKLTEALAQRQGDAEADARNRLAAKVSALEEELREATAGPPSDGERAEWRRKEGEWRLARESWERERRRRDTFQQRLEEDERQLRARLADLEEENEQLRAAAGSEPGGGPRQGAAAPGFYTEIHRETDAEGHTSSVEVQRPIPAPGAGGSTAISVTRTSSAESSGSPRPIKLGTRMDTTVLEKTLPLSLRVFNAIFSIGGLLPATRHDAGRLRPLGRWGMARGTV